MGDLVGVTRTIDHAVYMLLNALAVILWRIDAALIQFSLFSYATQDWLTGDSDGGVWQVLDRMIGADGIFGLSTWDETLSDGNARPSEAERQVLDGGCGRVQQQVAAGDADVDGPRPHVHGDVPGPQVEELDVVLRVRVHQLAGVPALPVARLG